MGNVGKIVTETEIGKIPFNLFTACTQLQLAQTLQNLPLSFVLPEMKAIRSEATNVIQKNPFLRLYVAAGLCFVCLLIGR